MIGIPVQPGKNGGIFNRVVGTPDEISANCKKLARQVEATIAENYGVALPQFARLLIVGIGRGVRGFERYGSGSSLGTWEAVRLSHSPFVLTTAGLCCEDENPTKKDAPAGRRNPVARAMLDARVAYSPTSVTN
jgi:hypothetical protein